MVEKLFDKYKEEKQFSHDLKDYIGAKCKNMQDKIDKFPVKTLKIISRFRFAPGTKITVQDEEYLLVNALKLMKEKYTKVVNESKESFYHDTIVDFMKDVKGSDDKHAIYFLYKKDIDKRFNTLNEDFLFCLQVIRTLPKAIKEQALNDKKK